jgi:hypothetical protein
MLDKKKFPKINLLTEEKLDVIGTLLKTRRKKSLRLFDSSLWVGKIYRSLWHKVAKVTPSQGYSCLSLLPPDYQATIRYCMWFQESVLNGFLGQNVYFILMRHSSLQVVA